MLSIQFDRFGGVASAICALHCLTISFIPSLLSNVQFFSSYNEILEWGFFSFALFFALSSLLFNWKKHKNIIVLIGLISGICFLSLGRMSEAMSLFEGGGVLSIIGGVVLFISHFLGIRCCEE